MYTDIRLEKGLYSITGKSFTQALSELDPDANYKGTELEQLDAYERQLKRFDIQPNGADCDRVEKFFLSTESAVLFPEYVRRQIKAGMDEISLLPYAAAAVTYTDSTDFRALTVNDGSTDSSYNVINSNVAAEGADLPSTTVRLAQTASALKKFARKLSCSYESIRKQRLEAFGVILRSLGAQLSRAINAEFVNTVKTGVTASTYSSAITYSALAKFWASMKQYDMDVMLCSPSMMADILALSEMKYCVSDYMSGGKAVTPYGVTIIKCPSLTDGTAVGIDSKCAAEAIFGTDVTVDFDKLISTQCDEIAASVMCGFSRLTGGAAAVLSKAS